MIILSKLFKSISYKSKTVNNWLNEYKKILSERNLKPKTMEIKTYMIKVISQNIGCKKVTHITPFDINDLIKIYLDQDKAPSAKCMFHLLRDIFREAYAQGWNDKNPTDPIKCPKVTVKRSRMVLKEFKRIAQEAEKNNQYHYLKDAMITALVTGQRRSDIITMKKSNVKRNYLFIEQYKTGSKIALPTKLTCPKIGISIQDIIESSVHEHVIHRKGKSVSAEKITRDFAKIRDKAFKRSYWKGTPTTFHEIRSLAERLYREKRVDTMTLLGHKTQATTDRYNDSRGREYKKLKIIGN